MEVSLFFQLHCKIFEKKLSFFPCIRIDFYTKSENSIRLVIPQYVCQIYNMSSQQIKSRSKLFSSNMHIDYTNTKYQIIQSIRSLESAYKLISNYLKILHQLAQIPSEKHHQ